MADDAPKNNDDFDFGENDENTTVTDKGDSDKGGGNKGRKGRRSAQSAQFVIMADHPRNSDLLIQSVPGRLRLRSTISGTKPATNMKTGAISVPQDQAAAMATLQHIPGMCIAVDGSTNEIRIFDGMKPDDVRRVGVWLKNRGLVSKESEVRPVPTRSEKLDDDRFKTLMRELHNLNEMHHIKVVEGEMPDMRQIEKMDGEFLLNPGSTVANTQPRYEKDFSAWVQKLNQTS